MESQALALIQSLQAEPYDEQALAQIAASMRERGEHEELQAILADQAERLDATAEGDTARRASVYRLLGRLRVEDEGDLAGAIEAYERALDAEPHLEVIRTLADLLVQRGENGDAQQAADLYCTAGDTMGAGGVALLERALDLAPSHVEALTALEGVVPAEQQPSHLRGRWQAFIESATAETPDVEVGARRNLLARSFAAEGRYRDALLWIAPLADAGDSVALSLREAFVANLEDEQDATGDSEPLPPETAPTQALRPRSGQTIVGFRVPTEVAQEPVATHDGRAIPPSHPPPAMEPEPAPEDAPAPEPAPAPQAEAPLPPAAPRPSPASLRSRLSKPASVAEPSAPARAPAAARGTAAVTLPADDDELLGAPPRKPWDKRWLAAGAVLLAVAGAWLARGGGDEPSDAALAVPARTNAVPAQPAAEAKTPAPAAPAPTPPPPPPPPPARAAEKSQPTVTAKQDAIDMRGGKLTSKQLASALAPVTAKLERCYQQLLKKKPSAEGTLTLTFLVAKTGKVANVKPPKGGPTDATFTGCAAAAVRTTRFPRPGKRPAQLSVPFELTR